MLVMLKFSALNSLWLTCGFCQLREDKNVGGMYNKW